jgi:hypothetical protein
MINALNIIIWSRRPILVTVVLGVFLDSPLLEKSTFRCCVDSEFFGPIILFTLSQCIVLRCG